MITVNSQYVPSSDFTFLVSGGVDSIAAAHWLKVKYRKTFSILHFNHNIQSANADMEQTVRSFAASFDIPIKVITRSNDTTITHEHEFRDWRLKEMLKVTGKFVTGHHLNDCVENYIDNCLKGIPEYVPIAEKSIFETFEIYHPFLSTKKQDFIKYCNVNGLDKFIVTDPTNKETNFKRNWIRNNLVKQIYDRNIGIEKVILKKFYLNKQPQ